MDGIYLDHNATTPTAPEVLAAMLPYFGECFGNPSSVHAAGRETRGALDEARRSVAELVGASPDEIVFTSGGTESDNLALRGIMSRAATRGRNTLVISAIEHPAVLRAAESLAREGTALVTLPVDIEGVVRPADLKNALAEHAAGLVSIMTANNETGSVQPVAELAAVCRSAGVPFHTDAVQAAGKVELAFAGEGIDLLSVSAHKFYGPKGVGALAVRRGLRLAPTSAGGRQEKGRRAGTENVPALVGMGAAARLALRELSSEPARLEGLKRHLWQAMRERIPGCHLNGTLDRTLPSTLNVSFEGVDGEALILGLDLERIFVSSASACSSGAVEPSHVLTAMGRDFDLARSSVRISLGRGNDLPQMDATLEALVRVVTRIRSMAGAVA
ncbi:MAG: cysteine desulfurase [Gemmatimonadetes bacterium]|nr:cysteine desulfurase [Gemmatimonadota bacterium]